MNIMAIITFINIKDGISLQDLKLFIYVNITSHVVLTERVFFAYYLSV